MGPDHPDIRARDVTLRYKPKKDQIPVAGSLLGGKRNRLWGTRRVEGSGLTGSQFEQLLSRNVKRFRGGPVFKVHRLLYHSILGSRVIKKKEETGSKGFNWVEG